MARRRPAIAWASPEEATLPAIAPPPSAPVIEPLPPGTRLVHIGPHKTGTTALQSAFHGNRTGLARQGVHYLGGGLQPAAAVTSLGGGRPLRGDEPDDGSLWTSLVAEARGAGRRTVVMSSEFLSDLGPPEIRRVVDDLGADDVHVLVTLRPLWRIAPSQWQQYVQNAHVTAWDTWLDKMLDHPPYDKPSPSFWRRHRHDRLIERWADAVGADRVTVVMIDDDDRTMLPRSVEQLLDLRPDTLQPRAERQNRGLTRPEIEVLRHLNRTARTEQWSEGDYAHLVRRHVTPALKQMSPDGSDARMAVPDWAVERLLEVGAEIVDRVAASGVTVIGDLDSLVRRPAPAGPKGSKRLEVDHAAAAITAAVAAYEPGSSAGRPLPDAPTGSLVSAMVSRASTRLRDRGRLALARRGGR